MEYVCPLPWVGFSNDPNGTVRPCCISKDLITDSNKKPYFIQKTSMKEIFHSEYMDNLRQEMLEGKQPSTCNTCWEDEKNGYKSKRLIYSDIHSEFIKENKFESVPDHPVDYQLILTNSCNLKCRSCTPSHSTSWQKEAKYMDIEDAHEVGSIEYPLPHGQPGNKESVLLKNISAWAPKITRLEVVGGEPFYSNAWSKTWRYLIDKGYSKKITLAMSTNCTVVDFELIDLLDKNFKTVGIGLSIDGIEDTFEYLRKNGKWDEAKSNILTYYDFFKNKSRGETYIQYTHTTSWVNAIKLPEFHNWVKENTPEFKIWINIVHSPVHMNLQCLPKVYKDQIKNKWDAHEWGKYKGDIDSLVQFMYGKDYTDLEIKKQYKKYTILDKYREENTALYLDEYFPGIIKYFSDE